MRWLFFILGFVTLLIAWSVLPALAQHSFSAHMAMHMSVVAVASPFLAFGIMGSRFDLVGHAPGFLLFSPIPASIVELVVVWGWHAPAPHHFARSHLFGLVLEQSLFLVSGLLVWLSCFGGKSPRDRSRTGAGIAGLLLTSMHMTLLGALLALSPRLLYTHPASHSSPSLTPLADQHLGGAIMLLVGGIAYLAGGLWLTRDLLHHRYFSEEVKTL